MYSQSARSSPIVLANKPDNTVWFCNDFRKVNEVYEFDAYPMPRVDELIECLGNARFITTLYLTKGYWQVPYSLDFKAKTNFAMPGGLWQYWIMPFGVWSSCYLPALKVLDSLRQAGLMANPKKCKLTFSETK